MNLTPPLIHVIAVALFDGFKRTAMAGGATTEAKWVNLTDNHKRIMYSLAHDAYRAQRGWLGDFEDTEASVSIEDDFLALMKEPL